MSITRVDIRVNFGACGDVVAALLFAAVLVASAPASAEVSQKLRAGLVSPSVKVRVVAVGAVAQTKDPEARALLEPLLADPDAAVRTATIDALGKLGDAGALAALERLRADKDTSVQSVLARVVPALEASRVLVYVGKGEDFSGGSIKGVGLELRELTRKAMLQRLGPGYSLHEEASQKSFGASPIAIRSIVKRSEGKNSFVDVKCELTLVEMPSSILRAALSTTASVGIEGPLNPKLEAELVRDGIAACAPSLAADFASYVRERARR